MTLLAYLATSVLMTLAALLVFRVIVRNSYRRHGRLTAIASLLESIYWGPAFAVPYVYNPPSWPVFWRWDGDIAAWMQYFGSALVVLGLVGVLAVMGYLGFRRSFGREVNRLRATGPYNVSRNPQVVSGLLAAMGIALRWPSWYALGWVALMTVTLHTMVLTEEEHLRAVFGPEYAAYCDRVPRYIHVGWGVFSAAA